MNHLFIADFPQRNTFLTTKQTNVRPALDHLQLLYRRRLFQLILVRVEQDRGDSLPDDLTVSKVLHHLVGDLA